MKRYRDMTLTDFTSGLQRMVSELEIKAQESGSFTEEDEYNRDASFLRMVIERLNRDWNTV